MTRDEIIRMAREAGVDVDTAWGVSDAAIERFATLVAEREREACAKECDEWAECWNESAQGAYDGRYDYKADSARSCAESIRTRSNT